MKLIGDDECYSKMREAEYGYDAYGNKLEAPKGWRLLKFNEEIEINDQPFDVYGGWIGKGYVNIKYHFYAVSGGRWTTFAREIID